MYCIIHWNMNTTDGQTDIVKHRDAVKCENVSDILNKEWNIDSIFSLFFTLALDDIWKWRMCSGNLFYSITKCLWLVRLEKRQKKSRTIFNDDEMSTFFYIIWLTVKAVEAEIWWDLWRYLILFTLSLVNLGIYSSKSFRLVLFCPTRTHFLPR